MFFVDNKTRTKFVQKNVGQGFKLLSFKKVLKRSDFR